ncbi:MAG: hypothetical protein ACJ0OB_04635 [Flavobacteriaceae bacterium]
MKKFKMYLFSILLTGIVTVNTNTLQAQDFGADLYSSYVWRGTQFGSEVHIQPWMEIGNGSLTGGVWVRFPTIAYDGGNELDLWISYDFGGFALTVTNYTFPTNNGIYGTGNPGLLDGDWTEISGSTDIGGLDLMVGYFTDAEALYVVAGFFAGAVDIGVGFGSDSKDPFYDSGDSGIVNLSFGGSKEMKITEEYSLPVSSAFI